MTQKTTGLEIAVIGISGRFPQSKNIETFWQNLIDAKELTSTFPETKTTAGGILEDVELFDASFFGFNPREAEAMDPQHRLFLESAWTALENAGYDSERESRPIGVYAGVGISTYLLYNLSPNQELIKSRGFVPTLIGVDKDYLPTRVSYKLNLTGPSVSVGTACSSSLVAVHLACQSLLSGECDMTLAAGVAIKVPQDESTLSPGQIVSPDGHCRAFAKSANGTIGGNGIGVVVLKRFEDAIADRDYIYGVIKGSAINNDGADKVGYTAPSQEGQARVIRAAQIMAEVEPESISYIEAHGTGTTLGDPIELAALSQAFRASTNEKGYCAIGSVKTNVGHLDAAAGITGFIKTILALDRQVLPPSLNFDAPNPEIDFDNSPFYVNTELTEWKSNGKPRRAGVSSFGFGGTNAHMILEEAPLKQLPVNSDQLARKHYLLVLSAKTSSALETATSNLVDYLKEHPEVNLADVAYTLQVGRRLFNHRRLVIVEDIEDAIIALESPPRILTNCQETKDRSLVFMFTGQGSQYINMARELYETEQVFRQECDRCSELLQSYLDIPLLEIIYPSTSSVSLINETQYTQPAIFVIEYALAKLWMSWGIKPIAMIGHSIGEYVVACLAGVFSLEDALALVTARGQLMQQLPSGSMLAIPLSSAEIQPLLNKNLSLGVVNGISDCVVSGTTEAIETLQEQLTIQGMDCRRLHTSHAFHSPMMEGMLEPFLAQVKQVSLNPPQIPYISNVTGTWITAEEATNPAYWTTHLRQTVRFAEGLAELYKQPDHILLEVGAGRTLSKLAKQHPEKQTNQVVLTSLRHPKEPQSDNKFILNTLGQLWLSGVEIDWLGFYQQEKLNRIPLPTYPFERQRYWIESLEQSASNPQLDSEKKEDISNWFYIPSWKRSITSTSQSKESGVQSYNLVFIDENGLGAQLVKRLKQQGEQIIIVKVGSQFAQPQEDVYTINPQQSNDYNTLINKLETQGQIPYKIIHLWTATANKDPELTLKKIGKEIQQKGFYSLLFLAQAIGKQNLTKEVQLTVISSNLQSITGEEMLSPEKATLFGAVTAITKEYPNINSCVVDIVIPDTINWQEEKLIKWLLTEINTPNNDEIIAYRGHNRWLPTFEPIQLDETLEQIPYLKEKGVYLITGGLGGIGLEIAEYLAKTVQAKLILTGHSTYPNREEWSQWLATHDQSNSISQKLQKVIQLEKLGSEVLVVSADVADLEQMQAVLATATSKFGQINGIVHGAGVPGGGAIQRKTVQEVERILAPKVTGTLVLNEIFKDVELDFFILFSSLASILGGFGQADYTAANAFLDAFAHYKTSTDGTFTTCINWDDWQEVGMAAKATKYLSNSPSLDKGLLPTEGIKVFQRILASKLPQVLVSTWDLLVRLDQNNINDEFTKNNLSESIQIAHSRPELNNAYVPPRNEIEAELAEIWQKLLGIQKVGIYDNFFELGGDSLISFQVALTAKQNGLQVAPNHLFEHPTIADLALVADGLETTEENIESEPANHSGSSSTSDDNPSSFPTANLSQSELEQFLTKINSNQ